MLLGARSDFIPIDLAAVSLGALPFSIYQTLAPDQIQYVVEDSGTSLIITETAYLRESARSAEEPARTREG